ncbi:aminodeoxychorismate synthase component I [Dyadobacter sandarakinus]|uniref:Aminodeoxychorismate synthase component I n=1 Tax=Dyadobacter sandarakinus TaxID=2747268 RepID=A0ABX7IEA9_9BACT|nr:aminodeoxychorismate synthase component I [Dyadobacter sandarakinus]QRR03231.1 aminodeoxychorismate synthase component I [Dyadobacter sandarakinus]
MTSSKDIFRQNLNEWGRRRIPFVFLIDYLAEKPLAWQVADADAAMVRFDLNGFSNDAVKMPAEPPGSFYFHKKPQSLDDYLPKFNQVKARLKAGDSFLVNLSQPTHIETNLTLSEIYDYSDAPYRMWYRDQFVCFSPEIFIKITGSRISAFPMKGTIDAAIPDAAQVILNDFKEAAEHATIVDLIRNDLSMVAQKVWVERYRYIDQLNTSEKTLLQVSSKIAGALPDDFERNFGDLLLRLLPAGSITGAPKPSTMRIIREAEGYERGYYTGVMGYFDGENFESAVMIRFIEKESEKLVFKSGGGITALSKAADEYQEMIDKVYLPFRHAPHPVH